MIAKLQGYVFGVGLELALACDFRIAADDMQMALPEATIGMIPGSGGTQRLARLVGLGRAKDIVMRGRRVEGRGGARDRARDRGRRRRTQLDGAVDALVAELSRHSPLSLAMAKRVLNTVYDGPLHVGLELEGLAYGLLQQTHDFREGVEAFVEKRKPEFDGTVEVALPVGERPHGALGRAHAGRERLGARERALRPVERDRVHLRVARPRRASTPAASSV